MFSPKELQKKSSRKHTNIQFKPHPHDILYGRGKGPAQHAGNMFLRQLTFHRKQEYKTTHESSKKRKIALEVAAIIKNLDPPGRFLAPSEHLQDSWVEESHEKALQKICQSLRETHKKGNRSIIVLDKKLGLLDSNGSFHCFSRSNLNPCDEVEEDNDNQSVPSNSFNYGTQPNMPLSSPFLVFPMSDAQQKQNEYSSFCRSLLQSQLLRSKINCPVMASDSFLKTHVVSSVISLDSLSNQPKRNTVVCSSLDPINTMEKSTLPLKKRIWKEI